MSLLPLYCRVPWTICVDAKGADADDFLRRQLTQNPPPRDGGRFTFAAWNDARGRVRALFRMLRRDDRLVLLAERDGVDAVLARLRMFVLRSKVELVPDESLAAAAVVGDAGERLEARGVRLGAEPGAAVTDAELTWLRIGPDLVYVVGPEDRLERAGEGFARGSAEQAELAEIRLGLPRVGAAVAERYVPQMLNLDRLDAVAFDKGCYPGQEVVARLHHLGNVKRRMRRFVGAAPAVAPAPGTPIVDAEGAEAGETIRAAAADGTLELLAVVRLDARGPLSAGSEHRVALAAAPLPYERASPV
ncbi:MAG TPA: hypothetical protein VF329_12825 [Gammaproteobacteria bacterium]